MRYEREALDEKQLNEIRASVSSLLVEWTTKMSDMVSEQQRQFLDSQQAQQRDQHPSAAGMDTVIDDMRDRQLKMVQVSKLPPKRLRPNLYRV